MTIAATHAWLSPKLSLYTTKEAVSHAISIWSFTGQGALGPWPAGECLRSFSLCAALAHACIRAAPCAPIKTAIQVEATRHRLAARELPGLGATGSGRGESIWMRQTI
mmetsp:Transcript_9733/g.29702  ORF Transcript_9733/g.29702 Transcript_9733/m.29702 type:complete len:108 (+) Transcript_9733:124-447(+)|eukprot:scaffold4643_cov35-Tisochrysis_lutea.AAC.1